MTLRILILAGFFLGTGMAVRTVDHGRPVPLTRPFDDFPNQVGDWRGSNLFLSQRIEQKIQASDYLYKIYRNGRDDLVQLYVGYYGWQEHGKMIHSPQNCLPGNGWYIAHRDRLEVAVPGGTDMNINRFLVENGIERSVVLYWYQQSGGRIIANEYAGRLYLVLDAFLRRRTDAALIRINIPVREDVKSTETVGVGFLKSVYPILMEFLPHEHTPRTS